MGSEGELRASLRIGGPGPCSPYPSPGCFLTYRARAPTTRSLAVTCRPFASGARWSSRLPNFAGCSVNYLGSTKRYRKPQRGLGIDVGSERLAEDGGDFTVPGLDRVSVDAECDRRVGVPQPAGHGSDVGAAGYGRRSGEVAKLVQVVVEPEALVEPGEGVAEVVGMTGFGAGRLAGEDVRVGVERHLDLLGEPLLELPSPRQDPDGDDVERQSTGLLGLGGPLDVLPVPR